MFAELSTSNAIALLAIMVTVILFKINSDAKGRRNAIKTEKELTAIKTTVDLELANLKKENSETKEEFRKSIHDIKQEIKENFMYLTKELTELIKSK